MADVFEDHPSVREARNRLWDVIEETPMLDWLLLTKRPENMLRLSPWQSIWPENVWAMTSVENQEQAEKRIPILARVPSVIRGLSVEPLIGPVDLRPWIKEVHWVIVGGESGAKARPMNPEWVYEIKRQCTEAEVPFFFKQWGEWAPVELENEGIEGMKRFGKKASGRLLEGRIWNEFPDAKKINPSLSRCPTPRAADPAGAGEELGAS
jgi:protein gp37